MARRKKAPVMDIQALAPERPVFTITTDKSPKTAHEMRLGDEFSPQEIAEIIRMSKQAAQIAEEQFDADEDREPDADQIELLGKYLDRIIEMAIGDTTPLTADEKSSLRTEHKLAIVEAFTENCLDPATKQEMAKIQPVRVKAKKPPPR